MKKVIFIFLSIVFLVHAGSVIYGNAGQYTSKFFPEEWKTKYEKSQWGPRPDCIRGEPQVNPSTCRRDEEWYEANKEEADRSFIEYREVPIGDDVLYAYAGWSYITGSDPTLLNAEIPPLGKYLIGGTILIFKNPNIFGLATGIFALIAVFLCAKLLLKDNILAFIPTALFSFEPLFVAQLASTHLDTLYLAFTALTLYFFAKEKYTLSAIFLGCMAMTKSPVTSLVLMTATQWSYLILTKKWTSIKKVLVNYLATAAVVLLSYTQFFLLGNSLIEFLRVQKWIIDFYAQGAKSFFNIWEIIAIGHWHSWWGTEHDVPEWNLLWPTSVGVLITSCIMWLRKKSTRKGPQTLFVLWCSIYLLFLTFVPSWPRYLLLFLPFTYNLAVWLLSKNISRISSRFQG